MDAYSHFGQRTVIVILTSPVIRGKTFGIITWDGRIRRERDLETFSIRASGRGLTLEAGVTESDWPRNSPSRCGIDDHNRVGALVRYHRGRYRGLKVSAAIKLAVETRNAVETDGSRLTKLLPTQSKVKTGTAGLDGIRV